MPDASPETVEARAYHVLVNREILAPVRARRLVDLDFAAEERAVGDLQRRLRADIAALAAAKVAGRKPRVSPRPRASAPEVLRVTVPVTLP